MSTLRVQLFGRFSLSLDQAPLAGPDQPRFQRLLAYLFLQHPSPVSRQQVAFLFWPDSTDAQARTNLRNLLHRLRQAWPQMSRWIDTSRGDIEWLAGATIEVDAAQFEASLTAASQAADPTQVESALRRAIAFYHGDLLPDIYDDWALHGRERLRLLYAKALQNMSQLLEDDRRYAEASELCQHLVRHEPLQESSYRHLMRLYALAGDRAAALRVYHTCATTLERELGVETSSQTREEYERLLNRPDRPRSAEEPIPLLPFVGRRWEWQKMLTAWQRARQGKSHLLLIGGEAGMGKTRLAEELTDRVRRQGFAVATARAYAAQGVLAYAPVAEWLRSPALQRALTQLDDIWLVEVARLLAEILPQHPHLPHPGPMQENWQRQRFLEGLTRLVAAAAQPILLVLDDLQWADDETMGWLHFLLRSNLPLRLLVVGTVRLGQVDNEQPLAALKQQLIATDRLDEIELGPLHANESAQLAAHIVGQEISTDDHDRYFQESEGNPLFLVEMLRAGQRTVQTVSGPPGLPSAREQPYPLPPKIHAVISARLAQLSAPAAQLVALAAVIGRQFTFSLLHAASGAKSGAKSDEHSDATSDELVQSLDELWRRRIVREQGDEAYDFSHGHIRAVAYGELSQARLRLLHQRVAVALEQLNTDQLDEIAPRLAAHWESTGDAVRAARYFLQAGEWALTAYLPRQALSYFERSADIAPEKEAVADALYGLGRAHFALEAFDQAIDAFQQALAQMDSVDVRRAKVLYAMADLHCSALYDFAAAEPFIHLAQAAAEAAEDWETLCQSLSLLGFYHSSQGNLDAEFELIQQALAIARRTQNRWREGRTLADLAFLQGQQSDFRGAEHSARQALALLQESDDKAGVAFAWNMLGRALGGRGAYTDAFVAFAHSEAIAASIEHRPLLVQLPNMRGWLHQQLQDFAGARSLDQEGVALAQRWGKVTAEISARINLCLDTLHLGDAAAALADLEELEPQLGEKKYGYHAWRWRLRILHAKGLCSLALGRLEPVLALANKGMTLAQSTGAQKYVALNHGLMGDVYAGMEKWADAYTHWQAALGLADRMEYQPLRWQGRYRLAQRFGRGGDGEQAEVLFSAAAQIVRDIAAGLDDDSLRARFLAAPLVISLLGEHWAGPSP